MKIDKLRKGTIVRLGGMTDCFQPIELDNRITYKIIKYLNKRLHLLQIGAFHINVTQGNPHHLKLISYSLYMY